MTLNFLSQNECLSALQSVPSNFIEIALRHGCSPVNFLHIFRTPFPKNTSGGLLLTMFCNLNLEILYRSSHRKCSIKKVFLKISHNSQENNLARVCNFIKKEALGQVFSCEFCRIFKNTFFKEHLRATASVYNTFAFEPGNRIILLQSDHIHKAQFHFKFYYDQMNRAFKLSGIPTEQCHELP